MAVRGDGEEVREKGLSLEVIGGMICFFDFLILFFLPAGLKLGHKTAFVTLMVALAVLGLALIVSGYVIRARAK
ncbi:MAG: hypothetical protein LAN64_20150 [Acidobacteriia bacterium]|nr:hypothetical protein [Terriglobia bacterium]